MRPQSFLRPAARLLACTLLLSLFLPLAACGGDSPALAASMHLKKTEGTVDVADGEGNALAPAENLSLYSGYTVATQAQSYAWIDLDAAKLAKLDAESAIEIATEGKQLAVDVQAGGLFFNVAEPLAEDETMEISTSSLLVGIRGTCGWVTQDSAALLEGTVSVTAAEQTVTVNAGEMAVLTEDGALEVKPFSAASVPAFVRAEVVEDEKLAANVLEAAGMDLSKPEPETPRYAEAIITRELDEVLYTEWVDFEGDGDPELLAIGIKGSDSPSRPRGTVWFYIFKGEAAEASGNGHNDINNGCWALRSEANPEISASEYSCSLVEADGRQFLEVYTYWDWKDSPGREEAANYYGFDAEGNWTGEHIYYMVNARGDISGSHVFGLYGPDTGDRDCDPDDFAATRARYAAVKQLIFSPDSVTVTVTAP